MPKSIVFSGNPEDTLIFNAVNVDFTYLSLILCNYYYYLEIVGLRVPARYIRDFAMFNVCSSSKNCPSARCASAANVVCKDVDLFGAGNVHINQFL
jgi:hypothetical protein